MKICTDCKNYQDGECGHKRNLNVSPVNGRITYISLPWKQRIHIWPIAVLIGQCGMRGRWFEQRTRGQS